MDTGTLLLIIAFALAPGTVIPGLILGPWLIERREKRAAAQAEPPAALPLAGRAKKAA